MKVPFIPVLHHVFQIRILSTLNVTAEILGKWFTSFPTLSLLESSSQTLWHDRWGPATCQGDTQFCVSNVVFGPSSGSWTRMTLENFPCIWGYLVDSMDVFRQNWLWIQLRLLSVISVCRNYDPCRMNEAAQRN